MIDYASRQSITKIDTIYIKKVFSNEPKPVKQLKNGKVIRTFPSIKEACGVINYTGSTIRKSIMLGKELGGYFYEYC